MCHSSEVVVAVPVTSVSTLSHPDLCPDIRRDLCDLGALEVVPQFGIVGKRLGIMSLRICRNFGLNDAKLDRKNV